MTDTVQGMTDTTSRKIILTDLVWPDCILP